MKERITAEIFEAATGRKPEDDDLERANCPDAGTPTHYSCGWCRKCNLPRTQCWVDWECDLPEEALSE